MRILAKGGDKMATFLLQLKKKVVDVFITIQRIFLHFDDSELILLPDNRSRGRMGGNCIGSDLVRLSTGIDYPRAVIQVATGQEPNLAPDGPSGSVECVYLLTSDDVRELERLRATSPEKLFREVYSSPRSCRKRPTVLHAPAAT